MTDRVRNDVCASWVTQLGTGVSGVVVADAEHRCFQPRPLSVDGVHAVGTAAVRESNRWEDSAAIWPFLQQEMCNFMDGLHPD